MSAPLPLPSPIASLAPRANGGPPFECGLTRRPNAGRPQACSTSNQKHNQGDDQVVEAAMENPEMVLELDMWDAANKLKEKEGLDEEVISRLIDIQYELVMPFGEVRPAITPPPLPPIP